MNGSDLIARERQRQTESEGWAPEHDDEHDAGQLGAAARCYVKTAQMQVCRLVSRPPERPEFTWPWEDASWKPSPDPIRNLVKAGALIAAEIDRLQRRHPREDKAMEREMKSGEKTMANMVVVTFDSPQARDEFLRKLAATKTKDEVAELLVGNADPGQIN